MTSGTFANEFESEGPIVGSWVSIGHPSVAEVTAKLGFDLIVIDLEHTPTTLETLQGMIHAIEAADTGAQPVIRLPWNDQVIIKRVLDLGPAGIIVPMVETKAEAESALRATQYPPDGGRGIAGSRATGYGLNFEEYVSNANDSVITIVQIETERGMANTAEIAAVDGIDGLFVGPADLSGSMGLFGEWGSEDFAAALRDIVEASHDQNTPVGTLALQDDDIAERVEQGFDFMVVGKDTKYIADGSRRAKNLYEQKVSEVAREGQD